jgi:C4-dicarboxylate-specific signal transduction histidine kinase
MIVTGSDKNRVMQKLPPVGKNWLIDRHASGGEETGITVNPLGVEVLASSKNIKSAGWYVVAALPTKEAFAPIVGMQKSIFGITVLLTVISGAAIWLMVRTELRQVTRATEILKSSTDLKEPLPVYGDDEITMLINGFNKLVRALNIREEELKGIVESEVLKRLEIEDKRQKEQTALIQSEKMAQLGYMQVVAGLRVLLASQKTAVALICTLLIPRKGGRMEIGC